MYVFSKIIAMLLTGLVAGLFYAFQCSVNSGLGQLGAKEYLLGFQAINKAIVNPIFFISFIGCVVVLPIVCWLSYQNGDGTVFIFLVTATVLYVVGVFGLTMVGNIPLNEGLANFNIHAVSPKELLAQREIFETPWNRYHLIRTIAAIVSFLLTILSIVKFK